MSPSPVKAAAHELGLPVTDDVADVLSTPADLGVVVAFGQILKAPILSALEMVNLHFSLLPRWRGAAPVERAILAGDTETGVCVMRVEEGLDTGPVLARRTLAIGPEESADHLRGRLVDAGSDLLVEVLQAGPGPGQPQSGEATYAAKIDPTELALEWSLPAVDLHRVVRVGGAWTTFRGQRFKVVEARVDSTDDSPETPSGTLDGTRVTTGRGVLALVTVQSEGRPAIDAQAWVRGARISPGERLGS